MRRWLLIPIALVLYAAIMAGVAWVVNATVPGAIDWLNARIGIAGVWAVLLAILIPAGIYGYWPRDAAGKARRLRSPWE